MASDTATRVRLGLPAGWRAIDGRGTTLEDDLELALSDVWQGGDKSGRDDVVAAFGERLRTLLGQADVLLIGFAAARLDTVIVQANVVVTLMRDTTDLAVLRARVADREGDLAVRVVTLACGAVVVAFGRSDTEEGAVFRAEYFVPVPDTDQVLLLAFRTPNVELADRFGPVFDAVAGSIEFAG
jgi:hypothetical protein